MRRYYIRRKRGCFGQLFDILIWFVILSLLAIFSFSTCSVVKGQEMKIPFVITELTELTAVQLQALHQNYNLFFYPQRVQVDDDQRSGIHMDFTRNMVQATFVSVDAKNYPVKTICLFGDGGSMCVNFVESVRFSIELTTKDD